MGTCPPPLRVVFFAVIFFNYVRGGWGRWGLCSADPHPLNMLTHLHGYRCRGHVMHGAFLHHLCLSLGRWGRPVDLAARVRMQSQPAAHQQYVNLYILRSCTLAITFLRCTHYTKRNQNVVHHVCCALLVDCKVPVPPPRRLENSFPKISECLLFHGGQSGLLAPLPSEAGCRAVPMVCFFRPSPGGFSLTRGMQWAHALIRACVRMSV